jgi:hypothetical protein
LWVQWISLAYKAMALNATIHALTITTLHAIEPTKLFPPTIVMLRRIRLGRLLVWMVGGNNFVGSMACSVVMVRAPVPTRGILTGGIVNPPWISVAMSSKGVWIEPLTQPNQSAQ